MMILFFRYKNVFSFWKWDYIVQFTDEDNQNKVEHTLEGGKKVSINTEGSAHKNKKTNCTAALQLTPRNQNEIGPNGICEK